MTVNDKQMKNNVSQGMMLKTMTLTTTQLKTIMFNEKQMNNNEDPWKTYNKTGSCNEQHINMTFSEKQ